MGSVQVFVAASLDGFIAGPNDEIDWLGAGEGTEDTFTPFLQQVGAILMGRRTFEVARAFEDEWPYGELPILVATSRPLGAVRKTVRALSGSIEELVDAAKRQAGERAVYIDGGALIRSALDAGLVDEITVAVMPIVLGAGIPLFAGVASRHRLRLRATRAIGGGLVELRYSLDRESKR
jgi:dihydrofolate reductase